MYNRPGMAQGEHTDAKTAVQKKNIVQNVKLIELRGNNLVPLHFVISKS